MAQSTHVDGQDRAIDSKFYLPAGVTERFDADRFERLWAKLFNHYVDPPE